MKKLITIFTILVSTCLSAKAINFINYIDDHVNVQTKLEKIESQITINKNLLSVADPNLRSLRKSLKRINKKHKDLYKQLTKKFKIEKELLASIKVHQKAMSFRRNDSELQSNLINAYDLARVNNDFLKDVVEDNKAKAFTESTGSGIYGKISMITGNCMPQVVQKGQKATKTCFEESFPTTVIIRPAIHSNEMDRFVHYSGIKEPLLILETNDSGMYKTDLAEGEYSVFILDEDGKEYCNSFDGDGFACRVTIRTEMQSEFNVSLDRAVY